MTENTPQDTAPVAPAADVADGTGTPSRFDDLDYRALQAEAKKYDDVAGNLPEAELRAALTEAERRSLDDAGDQAATQPAAPGGEGDLSRRDRHRESVGVPTSEQRAAALDEASAGTQSTISPADAIRGTMDLLAARRAGRSA